MREHKNNGNMGWRDAVGEHMNNGNTGKRDARKHTNNGNTGWRDYLVVSSLAACAKDLKSVPSTHMTTNSPL